MQTLAGNARILVVRLGALREVIFAGPAVWALRRRYPAATITIWVSPAGEAVGRCLPGVNDVFVGAAPGADSEGDLSQGSMLVRSLARRQFDAAFILTSAAETPYAVAVVASAAGIPVRVGQSREWGGGLLTDWVSPGREEENPAKRHLHLLARVGVPVAGPELRLTIPESARGRVRGLLATAGIAGDFVVVVPGATCAARRYPEGHYEAVLRDLTGRGLRIVLAGGVHDQALGAALAAAIPGVVSWCGLLSFPEIVALLAQASVFVGHDAGLMYVAHALAVPMVILYAGTEPVPSWMRDTAKVTLLRQAVACAPCYRLVCPYDQGCLDVDPRDVANAIAGHLPQAPCRTHGIATPPSGAPCRITRLRLRK